jgi:DNA-binding response OmpR family regulator
MLTARDWIDDRITGLSTGAEDYLVDPFDFGELLARLRGARAPSADTDGNELRVGDLTLEVTTHLVQRTGQDIDLSVNGVQILEVFMRHPGDVLSRLQLLDVAWDSAS